MPTLETTPLTYGSLDIITDGIPIEVNAETELIHLSRGFSSDAYRLGMDGDHVLKITKRHGPQSEMASVLGRFIYEHELNSHYLQQSIPQTSFISAPLKIDGSISRVVTLQNYVDGEIVRDHLQRPNPGVEALLEFFGRALKMFEETGKIPDLANIQERFRPAINTNIIVTEDEQRGFYPVLTDTNFGRIQRTKYIGSVLSLGIAVGIERLMTGLEDRRNDLTTMPELILV